MTRQSRFLTLRAATLGVLAAFAVAFGADDLLTTTHSVAAADRQGNESVAGKAREI